MSGPRFTVVTPSFNQARFLARTIEGVLGQRWADLEYFVMDGGSTDGSIDVIRRYEQHLAGWVSAPDGGQAAALNSAFRRASGDIFCWINSDDFHLPGAFHEAAGALADGANLVYGACLTFSDTGSRAAVNRPPEHDARRLAFTDYIVQPSAFWTRGLWEKTGELDESLHYAFDWEWFLRASGRGRFVRSGEVLSAYRFHAAHKSSTGGERREEEIFEVASRSGCGAARECYGYVRARRRALCAAERLWRRIEGRGFRGTGEWVRWLFPELWRMPGGVTFRDVRDCVKMLGWP